jgi:hypothetical protein
MIKTLFLNPPSFDGFDGGAGARYQAKREIRSFWYPTWLAQPAALVPNSRLVDAPVTSAKTTLGMKSALMVSASSCSTKRSACVTLNKVQAQATLGSARGATIFER